MKRVEQMMSPTAVIAVGRRDVLEMIETCVRARGAEMALER